MCPGPEGHRMVNKPLIDRESEERPREQVRSWGFVSSSLFSGTRKTKRGVTGVEEGAFSRITRAHGSLQEPAQTFLIPKYPIRIAKCEIHPAIMAITGKGNTQQDSNL